MPGLFNYRLWVYDHHVLHHPKVNGKHRDSFTPLSKTEFDALPAQRRWRERLYRAPAGLGFGFYYIFERWLGVKLIPRSFMPERVRREAWPHFAFLVVYFGSFVTALAFAPTYSSTGPVTAILLGFVLPYYVWMMLIGFTLYLQHTHPDVAWFDGPADRTRVAAPEIISTHIEFPHWLKFLMHNVYDHGAHHLQPRIPCYRLADAQSRLNEMLGPYSIKTDFTFRWFTDTVRRCKLYDYEGHRWLGFDGKPTTGRNLFGADIADAYVGEDRRSSSAA
jgi:acyl-lipid omega-6 desaturase (Delta-12 desaturase)